MNRANENNMNMSRTKHSSTSNVRWMLIGYDLIMYAVVAAILLLLYGGMDKLSTIGILQQVCLSVLCIFAARLIGKVYGQIANGGPVTVTDKRIIRYFMTIPEASQLVLQSGAIANNGELFVLDMGQPVKIMDLAENMIRLSGVQGIEIVETGLKPGEKLYEELLVKTEELDKTDNSMIFIERDSALSKEEIYKKIDILRDACNTGDDLIAKEALRSVVPTFKRPEDVNKEIA